MFVYELSMNGEIQHTQIAETPGKAKYLYWNYLQDGIWEAPFGELLKSMTCKKVGVAGIEHLFGNEEQFKRVCANRGIPFAYMGMKIEVAGKKGTIVGANDSCNLQVVMDGEWAARNCHPWWETRYFDEEGTVVEHVTKLAKIN